jgi:hypothetical protein
VKITWGIHIHEKYILFLMRVEPQLVLVVHACIRDDYGRVGSIVWDWCQNDARFIGRIEVGER